MEKISKMRLPFSLDALEPVISTETMDAHYNGHYANYVKKYNELVSKKSRDHNLIKFNYYGAILHELYWENLIPGGTFYPTRILRENFATWFEGNRSIQEELLDILMKIKGSGWALLMAYPDGRIKAGWIQNHRLETIGQAEPICVIDAWEHSYYLQYKYHKKDFFEKCMQTINWDIVEERYRSLYA